MPRRPRTLINGGKYHAYNRIGSGEQILSDPELALEFVELVREAKIQDGLTVFAWCVTPNHYHLVVRTGQIPASRSMHWIQGRFSQRFNRQRQMKANEEMKGQSFISD